MFVVFTQCFVQHTLQSSSSGIYYIQQVTVNNKISDIDLNESVSDNGDLTCNSIQNIST